MTTSDASELGRLVAPVHRLIRHEVTRLAEAVGTVGAGDERRAEALGTWAFDVADLLHHHLRGVATIRSALSGEDDAAVREAVRAGDRDHRALASEVALAMGAAVRWQDGAGTADRDALAVHLGRLRSGTTVAFARVEGDLAAAADRLVPSSTRVRAAGHALAALRGRRRLALLGGLVVGGDEPAGRRGLVGARRALARREYLRRTVALRRPAADSG
ncbi:MAG: hypothetical protein ACFCVF_13880 [Kineosporiaceae bacterium]